MRRRLLNLLTGLSLVLCVAVVALGVRTRLGACDGLGWGRWEGSQHVYRYVFTDHGVVGYAWKSQPADWKNPVGTMRWTEEPDWFRHSRLSPQVQEFVVLHSPPGSPPTLVQYTVPFWPCVVVLATPASMRVLLAYRSRNRRKIGLCPSCGYDLRATPERCPECGGTPWDGAHRTSGKAGG